MLSPAIIIVVLERMSSVDQHEQPFLSMLGKGTCCNKVAESLENHGKGRGDAKGPLPEHAISETRARATYIHHVHTSCT